MSGRRLLALLNQLRPDTLEVNDRLLLVHTSEWARDRGLPVLCRAMSAWTRRGPGPDLGTEPGL